jgi:hypothetical protein
MSASEIKDQLKERIETLSTAELKTASKDLSSYFDYLKSKKDMPKGLKLSFTQYLDLQTSLQEDVDEKVVSAKTVFATLRKRYA